MDILGFITLAIVGFTSCAEFGSYAFVHPVIRRLPTKYHIRVEQRLLKTFGRVMPVLMTLSVILAICCAVQLNVGGFPRRGSRVDDHLQCSDKSIDREMGRRQPPKRLEAIARSVGVLSRVAVLASAHRPRALMSGDELAFVAWARVLRDRAAQCG
jgi:hypothetical protein